MEKETWRLEYNSKQELFHIEDGEIPFNPATEIYGWKVIMDPIPVSVAEDFVEYAMDKYLHEGNDEYYTWRHMKRLLHEWLANT
jgi:hypothetical protein